MTFVVVPHFLNVVDTPGIVLYVTVESTFPVESPRSKSVLAVADADCRAYISVCATSAT